MPGRVDGVLGAPRNANLTARQGVEGRGGEEEENRNQTARAEAERGDRVTLSREGLNAQGGQPVREEQGRGQPVDVRATDQAEPNPAPEGQPGENAALREEPQVRVDQSRADRAGGEEIEEEQPNEILAARERNRAGTVGSRFNAVG